MKTQFLAFGALSILTACSGGQYSPEPVPVDPPKDKVEISISPSLTETRATDDTFETGDCIGLYVVNYSGNIPNSLADYGNYVDNMRFTFSGSTWTPDQSVTWNDEKTHADFYAYYPYNIVTKVNAMDFHVKADQSSEQAYMASDLMAGKNLDVTPTASAVDIPLSHLMSRAVISIVPGDGFNATSLAASKVTLRLNGLKCYCSVDLASGQITPTGTPVSVVPMKADDVYKAIIVPQDVETGNLISINVDGRDFNLQKSFTFESGKSHKFTVILNKTSTGVNVNITPWTDDNIDNGGSAF